MQNRVIGLPGRVGKRRLDVIWFYVRKILQNFLVRHALGQHPENVRDADAHPPNARPPAALARLDCDAFEKLHAPRILQRFACNKPAK